MRGPVRLVRRRADLSAEGLQVHVLGWEPTRLAGHGRCGDQAAGSAALGMGADVEAGRESSAPPSPGPATGTVTGDSPHAPTLIDRSENMSDRRFRRLDLLRGHHGRRNADPAGRWQGCRAPLRPLVRGFRRLLHEIDVPNGLATGHGAMAGGHLMGGTASSAGPDGSGRTRPTVYLRSVAPWLRHPSCGAPHWRASSIRTKGRVDRWRGWPVDAGAAAGGRGR